MTSQQGNQPSVRICDCAHGDVLDDDGKPVDPCPAGHSGICQAEAVVWLRPFGETNYPPDGFLCTECALAWVEDGEWYRPSARASQVRIGGWTERYLSVVPEKLSAEDVRVLLALIEEDGERFISALEAFVANSEDADHGDD